jgi:formylglycine-generating enzyme required for sulfatase activity
MYDTRGLLGCDGAVTGPDFWWGNEVSPEYANYDYQGSLGMTSPVGAYPFNPLGIADSIGNVWEWQSNPHKDLESTIKDYEEEIKIKFPDYHERKQRLIDEAKSKGIIK